MIFKDIHDIIKHNDLIKLYADKIVYETQRRRDESLSNEILQDAYIKLIDKQNINKRYVYLTLHNCLIDIFRQRQFVEFNDDIHTPEEEYDMEDDLRTQGQIDKVNEILQSLGEFNNIQEFYKNTLCGMYYGQGLSYRRIEAITGIPYNSVRKTIKEELEKIKQTL